MTRQIKLNGFAWIDVLAVVLLLAGLLVVLQPALDRERRLRNMTACSDNLQAIGKAISAYAGEYDGMLPVAGGRDTKWGGALRNWSAASRQNAFGLDPNGSGGQATISSSLYLLVRHMELAPKTFVCKVDGKTREFRAKDYGPTRNGPAGFWDFGPTPQIHCSYAYQMVYSPYRPHGQTSSEPGFAIAADRDPWIDPPFGKAGDFSKFTPDLRPYGGTAEQANQGNAFAHQRRGQNVLFLDMHVDWQMRAYCSLEDDNIYTSWDGRDKARGVPPRLASEPASLNDSLLVNDPVSATK
ncbi:MAG: hypothetical protein ACM3VT_18140 [Solirubrobacterales bacterium]